MRPLGRAIAAAFVAALAGCQDVHGPSPTDAKASVGRSAVLDANDTLPTGLILPPGTVALEARDVDGTPVVHFTLPEGYVLVSSNGAEPAASFSDGTLTCKCTKGKGCSPFVASGPGGKVKGCTMSDTCTQCTGQVQPARVVGSSLHRLASTQVDILHLASGVRFITGPEGLDSVQCLRSAAAVEWEPFRRGVAEFLDLYQARDEETRAALRTIRDDEPLPSGFTMTYINAYGKLMRVPMQQGVTITQVMTENAFAWSGMPLQRTGVSPHTPSGGAAAPASGKPTCRCVSGEGGCTYHSQGIPGLGRAEWCEAGPCSECAMEGIKPK